MLAVNLIYKEMSMMGIIPRLTMSVIEGLRQFVEFFLCATG